MKTNMQRICFRFLLVAYATKYYICLKFNMELLKNLIIPDMLIPTLGKTMKHVDYLIQSKLKEAGLSLTKKQCILMKLISEGPKPQNSLALITDRDKGSLTRLIQSLERKQYVKRIVSKTDKRVNLVQLTKKGNQALEEAKPVLHTVFKSLQKGITRNEKEAVSNVLHRIMDNAQVNFEYNCKEI